MNDGAISLAIARHHTPPVAGQRDSNFSSVFYGMIRKVMNSGKQSLTKEQIAHRFLGIYTKVDKSLESASAGVDADTYDSEFAAKIEDLLKDSFVTNLNKKLAAKQQLPTVEWMVVLNPNANEAKANMPFEEAACKERWFFDALFPPSSSGVRSRCGIDAVRSRLMEKYSAFCQQRVEATLWGQTQAKIVETHTFLEGWGWDIREEGTAAEQLEVLQEAVQSMFAEQKAAEFFMDARTKLCFDTCGRAGFTKEALAKCRKNLAGDAVTLGLAKDLPTTFQRQSTALPTHRRTPS